METAHRPSEDWQLDDRARDLALRRGTTDWNPAMIFIESVAVLGLIGFVAAQWGLTGAVMVLGLFSLALFPYSLNGSDVGSLHSGIATFHPHIYPYTLILIVGGLAGLASARSARVPVTFAILLLYLLVATVWAWGTSSDVYAGDTEIVLGVLAWICGSWAGRLDARLIDRKIVLTAAVIGAIQLVLCVLQLTGHVPGALGAKFLVKGRYGARAIGSLGNPGDLAKVAFLLIVAILPCLRSEVARLRRLTVMTVTGLLLVIGLTASRAVVIAVVCTMLLWGLFGERGKNIGNRMKYLLVGILTVGPFVGTIVGRFQSDPNGGARPQLLADGLHQLASNPWIGLGPNTYVRHVGQWSSETSLGLPVHNAVVLAAAEIGIPAAMLLFWPYVAAVAQALRQRTPAGSWNPYALALLASTPGIILIAWTGWGLVSFSFLPLWFLIVAFLAERSRGVPPRSAPATTVSNSTREHDAIRL
jgi:O-antigen ligase